MRSLFLWVLVCFSFPAFSKEKKKDLLVGCYKIHASIEESLKNWVRLTLHKNKRGAKDLWVYFDHTPIFRKGQFVELQAFASEALRVKELQKFNAQKKFFTSLKTLNFVDQVPADRALRKINRPLKKCLNKGL